MAEMISLTTRRVDVFNDGMHLMRFEKNTPREVPEPFVDALIGHGLGAADAETKAAVAAIDKATETSSPEPVGEGEAANTEGTETGATAETDAEVIDQIRAMIAQIEAEGDASKLTVDGAVRVKALEEALGFDTTKEQREAALESK